MIVPIIKWTEFHSEMPPTFRIVSFPSAGLLMPPWVGLVPQHAPVHALSESEHFLYFTDTQFPWMSGYNDLPPPPNRVGVCGIIGWCAGSRAEQFPDTPQEQPGTVQPHTRSQWFNNVTFSAKTMEKTLTWWELKADLWRHRFPDPLLSPTWCAQSILWFLLQGSPTRKLFKKKKKKPALEIQHSALHRWRSPPG